MKRAITALCGALGLSACVQPPPWVTLPSPPDATYALAIRTYDDGYGDQPFTLKVILKSDPSYESVFLSAETCIDVPVAQSATSLVVFYDEIGLTDFSNTVSGISPRPTLCDLGQPECAAKLKRMIADGAVVTQACTLTGRPGA